MGLGNHVKGRIGEGKGEGGNGRGWEGEGKRIREGGGTETSIILHFFVLHLLFYLFKVKQKFPRGFLLLPISFLEN